MESTAEALMEGVDNGLLRPIVGRLYWIRYQDNRLLAIFMASEKWVRLIDGVELTNITEFELA